MTIIYNAYKVYLAHENERKDKEYKEYRERTKNYKRAKKGKLWPSDMSKCKRATMLRINREDGDKDFPFRALDYMNTGLITEDATLKALQHMYADRLTDQVVLKYGVWSGKADFGIDIGGENPIIIEHKTTSEKHFSTDSNTAMPRKEHIGQAMLYHYLYKKIYGVAPTIVLFYKAWGVFAEFVLKKEDEKVYVESNVNGVSDVFYVDYDVYAEIEELESWYNKSVLPDKLDKKWKGCSFKGQPSCPYYKLCWGED